MRQTATYHIANIESFKQNLLSWASQFQQTASYIGETAEENGLHMTYDMLVGADSMSTLLCNADSFDSLKSYHDEKKDWIFGFLSYDLKNEVEDLQSNNTDELNLPNLYFFQPKWVFGIIGNDISIHFPVDTPRKEMQLIFKEIMLTKNDSNSSSAVNMNSRISKSEYISTFNKLQEHIKRGDIYEVNFCQEYFAKSAELNPVSTFQSLYEISNSPFSAFFRTNDFYLMSASPERFVKKVDNTIISQPIKGTRKRGNSFEEDLKLKEELRQCPKEQSENVMIVDLVRNDLSKTAQKSSVKVEELFGIYSFTQVHQMISTVTSELKDDIHWSEVLKTTFPMGSMTGAPKIRAMQLIEEYETFKRGLYSGSVGYVTPNGDFDFNVIIRSILYNATNGYVSLSVGSAITANAKGDDEYAECELKAKAMLEVLNA